MLSKLLKYEIKATSRSLLPLYLVLVLFAIVNRLITLISGNEANTPAAISMLLYVTIFIGVFVMTFIVMIQRFYKNLLTDEGYLMFTLPTKSWKHITTKLLISMMWTVLSGIVGVLSIMIITFDGNTFYYFSNGIADAFQNFVQIYGNSAYLVIPELIIAGLVGLAYGILMLYCSISIGHLFNKHKVLISFGAFLVLQTISQILFVLMGLIPGAMEYHSVRDEVHTLEFIQSVTQFMIWWGILFAGILAVAFFFVTNHILSKRLNLE